MLLVLIQGGGLGCDSESASSGASRPASGKVSSAAKNFLGFARGEASGGAGAGGHVVSREVRYTVARSVLVPGPRPVRRVEIQVPLKIEPGELEARVSGCVLTSERDDIARGPRDLARRSLRRGSQDASAQPLVGREQRSAGPLLASRVAQAELLPSDLAGVHGEQESGQAGGEDHLAQAEAATSAPLCLTH